MLALFLWLHPPRQKAWRSGYPLKSHFHFNQMGATAAIPCRVYNTFKLVIWMESFFGDGEISNFLETLFFFEISPFGRDDKILECHPKTPDKKII